MVPSEAITPMPAKQVQTAGGKPRAKHDPAAVNPLAEMPPAAPMQAAQLTGPDCTLVRQDRMTITSSRDAEILDIVVACVFEMVIARAIGNYL